MDKTNKTKVVAALGVAVVSLAALAGVAVHDVTEAPVVVNNTVTEYQNVMVEVPVEVIKEVPVNVTVTETVMFEDETFKALACDRMVYDDVKECVEEVTAEDAALQLAFAEIEANFADELQDAGMVSKERDARLIEIYTDFEDVVVVKSNFDNEMYKFDIEVKYEDTRNDNKGKAIFTVVVEDGEPVIKSVA